MTPCNQLAHRPGTAVQHDPEAVVRVGLNFQEMVAATKRAELDAAVAFGGSRQNRMT